MRLPFIFILLLSSILLTIYLVRKNQVKAPIAAVAPTTATMESSPVPPPLSTLKLSIQERILLEDIEDYIDSLSTNQVAALRTVRSPILYDAIQQTYQSTVRTNEQGLPIFAYAKHAAQPGKETISTNYVLKNGHVVRVEHLLSEETNHLLKRMQFDYFQETKRDTLSYLHSMEYIGTKKLSIGVKEPTTNLDTMTQYLKFWLENTLEYPETELNQLIDAAFQRGDFALQLDSILEAPLRIRVHTFNRKYFADFEVIEADSLVLNIKETWPDFKGDIMQIEFKLAYDKEIQRDKNYYVSGRVN